MIRHLMPLELVTPQNFAQPCFFIVDDKKLRVI